MQETQKEKRLKLVAKGSVKETKGPNGGKMFEIPYKKETQITAVLTDEPLTAYEKDKRVTIVTQKPKKKRTQPPTNKTVKSKKINDTKFIFGKGNPFKFSCPWKTKQNQLFQDINDGVDPLHISKNYTIGNTIIFPSKAMPLGKPYWLEAFNDTPCLINNFNLSGAWVVMVEDKPYVKISLQRTMCNSKCPKKNKDTYCYGENVRLNITMHSNTKHFDRTYLDIEISCGSFKKLITSTQSLKNDSDSFGYNKTYSTNLLLNTKWRGENKHEDGTKEYTITARWHKGKSEIIKEGEGQQCSIQDGAMQTYSTAKTEIDTSEIVGTETIKIVVNKKQEEEELMAILDKQIQIATIASAQPSQTQHFEPCFYKSITIEEELEEGKKRTVKLFEENNDGSIANNSNAVFEMAASSDKGKKKLYIIVDDWNTQKCLITKTADKHKVDSIVITRQADGETTPFTQTVNNGKITIDPAAKISNWNLAPFNYIWPRVTQPVVYSLDITTCRYTKPVIVKVYPDIKWELEFFLNLTNDLSVKWQNMSAKQHEEYQKKAGKIGAERRWEQKDISFGFKLDANWNKLSKDKYEHTQKLGLKYETKFKKLYDLFSSVGSIADGITNKTKGTVRNIGLKGLPVAFEVKPPNFSLNGKWLIEPALEKNELTNETGTKIDISFDAQPLIGLEITIDLLGAAIGFAAGAISGGTASKPALELYQCIKDKINTGVEANYHGVGFGTSGDIYVDLVISGIISSKIDFNFNTAGDNSGTKSQLELKSKLGVELKAGAFIKGKLTIVIVKVETYFKLAASAKTSVTFGHTLNYDREGLYYRPVLGFDGLTAEYIISADAGISLKKSAITIDDSEGYIITQGQKEIVKPFDVIKSLEEVFGISANITIIKKD